MTTTYDGPKAIETRYAGCRFRSRLEARWAVFFDALGVSWQYEQQGYRLAEDYYLPDFEVVFDGEYYFEVKGDRASPDLGKVVRLCVEQERATVIGSDIPRPGHSAPDVWLLSPSNYTGGYAELSPACFIPASEERGDFRIEPFGHPRLLTADSDLCRILQRVDLSERDGWVQRTRKVDNAFKAARGARFEHGESGAEPR